MNEDGKVVAERSVQFERMVPGPADRVWAYLTEGPHIAAWFGHEGMSSIEPRVGGTVNLGDGHIRGVVTQWKPGRRLTFTWNVFDPGQEESDYPESYVTFELEPVGDEVKLTLTHRPFTDDVLEFLPQTLMGWHTILDALAALVRGEAPEPWKERMERNKARYGVGEIKR